MKLVTLATLFALLAPYQCNAEKRDRPMEDTAPQALWILAERFEQDGDAEARKTTLEQLIERYPSSRYAQRARDELGLPDPARDAPSSAERTPDPGPTPDAGSTADVELGL